MIWRLLGIALLSSLVHGAVRGDSFDRYTNPILAKVPGAEGVKAVKQLTSELLTQAGHLLPDADGALVMINTNGGRHAKLLVQAARQKIDATRSVPILLIERFMTYREGQERAMQASGQNIFLFDGFHFSLDLGQVIPAGLGGDLRCRVVDGKPVAEPIGKAELYLLTRTLLAAAPPKRTARATGGAFDPAAFDGTYKLFDDGRRTATLSLKVSAEGEVTGSYYSGQDGQKYDVKGKLGSPRHAIQFTVKFPRAEEEFQGWLFTGTGQAIAGFAKMQDRIGGFYALRTQEAD